jgi:hypothetical protein
MALYKMAVRPLEHLHARALLLVVLRRGSALLRRVGLFPIRVAPSPETSVITSEPEIGGKRSGVWVRTARRAAARDMGGR